MSVFEIVLKSGDSILAPCSVEKVDAQSKIEGFAFLEDCIDVAPTTFDGEEARKIIRFLKLIVPETNIKWVEFHAVILSSGKVSPLLP